jgi:MFS family permease
MHLADGRLRATCVIGACMLFSMVAAFTYANFRLAAPPFGLTPGQLGTIFAVYLLGLVTTTLATRLAIRLGRRTTLLLSVGLSAFGTALTLGTHLPSVILGLGLLSGGMFVVQTLSLGFIAEHVRQAKSSAVGLYVTTYYIGGAAGGVLPAALWRHYGWPGVALLLGAAAAIIAALGALFWPRHAYTVR